MNNLAGRHGTRGAILAGVLVALILVRCTTSWGGTNTCLPGWLGQLLVPVSTTGLPG